MPEGAEHAEGKSREEGGVAGGRTAPNGSGG